MKRRLRRWWRRLWASPPKMVRIERTTWDPSRMDDTGAER